MFAEATKIAQHINDAVASNPTRWVRLTRVQHAFITDKAKYKLLRVGNGIGKSFVSLLDVYYRAIKKHPYRPEWNHRIGPQEQWIVTVSWSQAVPLMEIFRSFLSENEVAKQPAWTVGKGWGKDSPAIVFKNGSVVRWRTMDQGARRLAGAGVDHVLIDEPPKHEHFRELERRVNRRNGDITLSMTPINTQDDISWLRDKTIEGVIKDLNYPMGPDLYTFLDGTRRHLVDGTVCDDAWVEKQKAAVSVQWRDIVLNGGWSEVFGDGVFVDVFSRSRHVSRPSALPSGSLALSLGIDHGTKSFTETAVLVAVDESGEEPVVWIIGTHESEANSPPDADARGIVAMLKYRKVSWEDLDAATGDIAHYGGRGTIGRKTNKDLEKELRKTLMMGRTEPFKPPLQTAKSGAGANPRQSVDRGLRWIWRALQTNRIKILDDIPDSVITSFERYRGGSSDPAGHLMDALRYALRPWIENHRRRYQR